MNFKQILILVLFISASFSATCQNSAYSNNVGSSRFDNASNFKRNQVSIIPFVITETGKGFGVGYEHFFGKKGVLSFYIPIYFTKNTYSVEIDTLIQYGKSMYTKSVTDPMYYVSPGIKFYPKGSNGVVKYALGLAYTIANGTITAGEDGRLTYNFAYTDGARYNRSMTGCVVNNSLNILVMSRIHIALETGFGLTFSNNTSNTPQDMGPLYYFSLQTGYRF